MILFSLLLPLLTLANPPAIPAPGLFHYEGRFEVLQKRVAESVNTATENGRARAGELRAQGYACVYVANDLVRCMGYLDTKGTETEVAFLVNRSLQGASLELFPAKGDPSLTIDGEVFEEWAVPQKVTFLGKTYESYRYQILKTEDLHKLYFGEEGVVRNPTGFGYVKTFQRQLRRDVIATYIVNALFE